MIVTQPGQSKHLAVTVNLLWLRPGKVGGSENYVIGLLAALSEFPDALDLEIVASPATLSKHAWLKDRFSVNAVSSYGNRAVRFAKEWQMFRPAKTQADRLVHHLGGYIGGRIGARTNVHPAVVTIHDTQFLDLPDNFSAMRRQFLKRALTAATAKPNVICVVSYFTARQLVKHFDVEPQRCHVVPPPIAPPGSVAGSADQAQPFVLYPAVTWAHKRHSFLVDVAKRLSASDGLAEMQFVLCGAQGPSHKAVLSHIAESGMADRFTHLGRINATQLAELYTQAHAVVFPSQYEGVGLPMLEAMAHGCPVVTSDHEALIDTTAGAAINLPLDAELWSDALMRLSTDADHRQQLVAQGRERAGEFTAQQSAQAQLAAYADGFSQCR